MVRFSVGKLALAAADGRTRWWGPHQLHKGEVPYLQLLPLGQAQVCVCVSVHARACLFMRAFVFVCAHLWNVFGCVYVTACAHICELMQVVCMCVPASGTSG